MAGRARKRPPAANQPEPLPPLVVNGWTLLGANEFMDRWTALHREVERLRSVDPDGYRNHPLVRFFRSLSAIVLDQVPQDPGASRYRQGNTLGPSYRGWHRAKFNERFRLFFRFSSRDKIIVYGWLNDEATLRKEGARTDPYAVFARMLDHGKPPNDWDELVAASASLSSQP
jgi:toxin YhaV